MTIFTEKHEAIYGAVSGLSSRIEKICDGQTLVVPRGNSREDLAAFLDAVFSADESAVVSVGHNATCDFNRFKTMFKRG